MHNKQSAFILVAIVVTVNSSIERLLGSINDTASISFSEDNSLNGSNESFIITEEPYLSMNISRGNVTKSTRRHHRGRRNQRRQLLVDGERRGGRLGRGNGALLGNNAIIPNTLGTTTIPNGLGTAGTAVDDNRLGLGQGLTLGDVLGLTDTLDVDNTIDVNDLLGLDTDTTDNILDLNDLLNIDDDDTIQRLATLRRLQRQAASRFIEPSAPIVIVEFEANEHRDILVLEDQCEDLECEEACCVDGFGPWCCTTDQLIDELDLSNAGSIPVTFGDLDDLVATNNNEDSSDEGARCRRHRDCDPGFVCRRSLDCDLNALLAGEECDRFCELQDF